MAHYFLYDCGRYPDVLLVLFVGYGRIYSTPIPHPNQLANGKRPYLPS
ncbi:MAG: hypothetical protein KC445_06735 [Anaerolineales bacterium]|nr:hypothetical protein [Anaerolineales bacterium]